MEYIIAVFSVRTETLSFNQYLHRLGINSTIINTPPQVYASCGLCVKFPQIMLNQVKRISLAGFKSFVGFYAVSKSNFGSKVRLIK